MAAVKVEKDGQILDNLKAEQQDMVVSLTGEGWREGVLKFVGYTAGRVGLPPTKMENHTEGYGLRGRSVVQIMIV